MDVRPRLRRIERRAAARRAVDDDLVFILVRHASVRARAGRIFLHASGNAIKPASVFYSFCDRKQALKRSMN